MSSWIALIVAIASNIGAVIAFKYFVDGVGDQLSSATIWAALRSPALWLAVGLGVVLLVSFLYAMRGIPLTIAYTAATCLTIVGVAAAGLFLFDETLNLRTGLGMVTVLTGVLLLVGG